MLLSELVDQQVVIDAETTRREPGISPSNIGSCLRKLILMDRNAPHADFSANQLKVFGMGNIVEKYVLDKLESITKHRQLEVSYSGFKGTLDAIVEMDGKLYLIDTKSVKKDKFGYLDVKGIDEHYAFQLTFYWLGAKAQGINLEDNVCLFYVQKDDVLFKEMWFKPSSYKKMLDLRIDDITFARKDGRLPSEYDPPIWECFSVSEKYNTVRVWCNYISSCPNVLLKLEQARKDMENKITAKEIKKLQKEKKQ